jgi:hypothetical protein
MAVTPFSQPSSQSPTSVSDAHGVRARSVVVSALLDDYDFAGDQIIRGLHGGPARSFDLDTTVVVTGSAIEPRVVVRMDGSIWILPTLEAALLALRIRLEPGLRAADLFADAFALASRQAEARLAALHDWSAGVRPTQDVE